MGGRDSDLKGVFDRAATRLKLAGRRRKVGWHYFRGEPRKAICICVGIPEGTMKADLASLHARLETRSRAEFVHRIYEVAGP